MKILLDIWSLASENGGPTRSAKGLACALAGAGAEVVLVSHIPGTVPPGEMESLRARGVRFVEGRGIKRRVALEDTRRFLDGLRPDVVHVQGMWKMSTHAMNVVAAERKIPVVISPRGMLDPWALSVKKWKKRLGMFLYQRGDLKRAAAFHAAAEMEAEHIRAFGLRQPVIVAPNGVEVPDSTIAHRPSERRTALFRARLHPGKGLLLLAEAWAQVRPAGWKMVVAGPDERGHRAEVEAAVARLGVAADWSFVGEVDDVRKWPLYRSADLFVHPSASENFGLSIAEALASGVPVITTHGTPWRDVAECRCGWWIERNAAALAETLRAATSLSDAERAAMGERGRRLVREKYSWTAIGGRMKEAYENLLRG